MIQSMPVQSCGHSLGWTSTWSRPLLTCFVAAERQYDIYLMDLNLGAPGEMSTEPAEQVYALVKDRVEAGEARFLGISGDADVVKLALTRGIPAAEKDKFRIAAFLKQ